MGTQTLSDIAEKMRGIDIATLATHTDGGQIAGRPMSNNGDVDYDGDSFYFTYEKARTVRDIEKDKRVSLSFVGKHHFYATVEGEAELIRDKATFRQHWTKDLDRWFDQGIDTPGIALIKVHAKRVKYWDGLDDGELQL